MYKEIALAIVALIGLLLAYAATRPGSLRVQRSATIAAPPQKIFPLINDFHRWEGWSPYERRDPAMKKTYSGAASGTGAVYEWAGNRQVGEGRMEIVDAASPSRVAITLHFVKPFEGRNVAEFALVPQGAATNVSWTMDGPSPYMMKVMGIFMNMDKMIGADFELGLANLKALAER